MSERICTAGDYAAVADGPRYLVVIGPIEQ
jgi:hypothetical protein